jgi:hypothetical protein
MRQLRVIAWFGIAMVFLTGCGVQRAYYEMS